MKIGFVAHGPASANSLLPLINNLKDKTEIELFAYHPYVSELWECELISDFEYPPSFSTLDIVIYGTGSGHYIECDVPVEARKHGIISISILDCWWSSDEDLIKRFKNKPMYLIVPNQEVSERILKLKTLNTISVFAFGNPYFDRLKDLKVEKKELAFPLDVAFFSQCQTSGNYSDTHFECKDALVSLVDYKNKYPNKIAEIIVTPHPREDTTWIKDFCERHGLGFKPNESTKYLYATDISVGVSCTLQYEAQIIRKPTIFYKNKELLETTLNNLNQSSMVSPITDFNATDRCLRFIDTILNHQKSA